MSRIMEAKRVEARRYANGIRNEVKKIYAEAIIEAHDNATDWPGYPNGISFMAAQAVHMQMEEIFGVFANMTKAG